MGGLRLEPVVARTSVPEPTHAIRCPCGFEARSGSIEEVVRAAQKHVREVHGQELTEEQGRALIETS